MPPLVSCLCVTEGRAAFHPWLWWNYAKQDHPHRELIVVTTPAHRLAPSTPLAGPDVTVVEVATGSNVPAMRNAALDVARGDYVAWFDDDDWQHPARLSTLLTAAAPVAGGHRSWFINLATLRAEPFQLHQVPAIFNTLLVAREVVAPFDETVPKASDTPWMASLPPAARVAGVWAMWLSHGANLSNPAGRREFHHPLEGPAGEVGEGAWAGTSDQLAALRHRLAIN